MTRRLPIVLNTLMENIEACKDDELRTDLVEAVDTILISVDEYDGLNTAMSVMLGLVKHDDHRKRAAAETYLATFFTKTHIDYSRYYPDLIRVLLIAFDDGDSEVVKTEAGEAPVADTVAELQAALETLVGSTPAAATIEAASSETPETPAAAEEDAINPARDAAILRQALDLATPTDLKDASKPYATPWRPREFMSAFAFIPRYLEVNHNICAAVYLRHPVARPGISEVPSPFSESVGTLAYTWYLRRR